MNGRVLAVSRKASHTFSKENQPEIYLLEGLGVQNDAHAGVTVKHRSRVARDPSQPNLRQVHLIHSELHQELREQGYQIAAGQMGENITTEGIDLLSLPVSTLLHIGETAIIQITGLRNPCAQIDNFQNGLMKAVLDHDEQGQLIRKSGIMAIVLSSGPVRPGDTIAIELPAAPHRPLEVV